MLQCDPPQHAAAANSPSCPACRRAALPFLVHLASQEVHGRQVLLQQLSSLRLLCILRTLRPFLL